MGIPDNYDLWEAHNKKQEAWLASRPVCSHCKKHIQDEEALHIGDEWLCLECIEDNMEQIED